MYINYGKDFFLGKCSVQAAEFNQTPPKGLWLLVIWFLSASNVTQIHTYFIINATLLNHQRFI